jgi:hypothetical protein
MPTQNYNFLGTNDWLNLLASHEYRHVVQYQHANRGFNKVFYYLFGANTLSAMAHVAAPQWFWEGDAVATETAFTHSGRGRIPNFGLLFKTNLMEGRTFNYHKQYLRSYRHNIPNHYVLGFHMVGYLRKRTNDPDIWEKITARSWNVPFIPFAFSNAIKRETGLHVTGLYKAMATDLKKDWQKQIDSLTLTTFEKVNSRKTKTYTDYLFPQPLEDGSIVVLKEGMGDIEQFRLIKNGEENSGYTPGFINDNGMLSAAKSRVVWSEYGYDLRWGVRNYSLIKGYDFKTKTKYRIGKKRDRYAGASLSPDGTKVAAIRSDNNYKVALVILDFSGKILKEFVNPDNSFISMPRWSDDGKRIVALKTTPQGRTVLLIDAESGNTTDLFPASQENIGHPVLYGKFLLFNSPATGIDNIFAYNIETKTRYQITTSKYGAYNPSVSNDGKTIYYNDQYRDGMDVVQNPFDPSLWKPYNTKFESINMLADLLTQQEGRPGLLDSVPVQTLTIAKYSKLKGMINPYSWGAFIDNTLAQATIGVSSQDILSTTSINLGYQYDIAERTGLWKAGLSYQGFYPIIDASVTTGNRHQNETIFDRKVKFTWRETGFLTGLRLPLTLTNSKYITQMEIGNSLGITQVSSFRNEVSADGNLISTGDQRYVPVNDTLVYVFNNRVSDGMLLYNDVKFSFARSLKRSYRDFNSRFAQSVNFEYLSTPYGGDFKGRLLAVRGSLYFPGLFKHHSLYIRGGYQSSYSSLMLNTYDFRNVIFKPRGYSYPRDTKFYSVAFNYALPVWYPDISIGPLLNIQRIKANLFYDYGRGEGSSYYYHISKPAVYGNQRIDNYNSVGAEVSFDINIMRFLPQFEIGFRATYLQANRFNTSGVVFEFLLGNIPF